MKVVEKKTDIVNLYIVHSPLHCLCAEWIVKCFEPESKNIVFFLKKKLGTCLNSAVWDDVVYLPWPRFDPEQGIGGRIRRTRNNLEIVAKYAAGVKSIRLHATVIDTEAINYHINFLRASFPEADFCVRLIPDGVMNLKRHPQGWLREQLKHIRLLRGVIFPELKYYFFKGDRTGADDSIVDRIYTLPFFPHEYDPDKVIELPPFMRSEAVYDRSQVQRRALVVGQPLILYKRLSKESAEKITYAIRDYLKRCGIEEVFYKSHPRDATREYGLDEYKELIIDEPLEQHLARHPYGIVIGVCSTALLTGRMVMPEWCEVVSCGMNLIKMNKDNDNTFYIKTFETLRVKIVNA